MPDNSPVEPFVRRLLFMSQELLAEAASLIRKMDAKEFDRLEVRHFLCDEMEGAVLMIRDRIYPS